MTDASPTFSVVIPTHARPHYLARALNSVYAQDVLPDEIVVVDDASPDPPDVDEWETRVPPVRLVVMPENGGPGRARNAGVAASTSDFVVFLDDDDEFLPGFVRCLVDTFAAVPAGVGFGWTGVSWGREKPHGFEVVREGTWTPRFEDRQAAYRGFLVNREVGTNCGLVVRRTAFDAAGGFDPNLRNAEDTDLLVRLARDYDFRVVPCIGLRLHIHEGARLRRDETERLRAYEQLLARHSEAVADAPEVAAALHHKVGWLSYHAGHSGRARKHLAAALRARPFQTRSWTFLLLTFLPRRLGKWLHVRLSEVRRGKRSLAT